MGASPEGRPCGPRGAVPRAAPLPNRSGGLRLAGHLARRPCSPQGAGVRLSLSLPVCKVAPGARGGCPERESERSSWRGGRHRRSATERRVAAHLPASESSTAQNETRIAAFPVREKPPRPACRLGGASPPCRLLWAGRGFTRNSPCPAHPPALSGRAPGRRLGAAWGACLEGGCCAPEALPGLGEVSVLSSPCTPVVPAVVTAAGPWVSVPGHSSWP